MKVIIHDSLQRPQIVQATRVLVYDDLDNPIALALRVGATPDGHDMVLMAHIGEPGGAVAFNNLLKEMGVDKTVVITDAAAATPLQHIKFDG